MERIKIGTIQHNSGYFQFSATFIIDLPNKFSVILNKKEIAESYGYSIVQINGVEYFSYTLSYSFANSSTSESVKSELELEYANSQDKLNNFVLQDYDTLSGDTYNGNTWQL